MSNETEMRAILQELHDKFGMRVYGTSSYIKKDMRDRIAAALVMPTQAPAATEAPSKPFAYYIHIAAEQRGEFVHDLDEALDDLTNCECKITELFDHAPPVAECPYCHACWPECLHCDGTGRAVQAPSLREVCAALLSLIRRDAPNLSGKVLGEAEAALAAVGASVQPVQASLSDEQRLDFLLAGDVLRFVEREPSGMWRVYHDIAKHGEECHAWRAMTMEFHPTARAAIDAALASSTPTKGGQTQLLTEAAHHLREHAANYDHQSPRELPAQLIKAAGAIAKAAQPGTTQGDAS